MLISSSQIECCCSEGCLNKNVLKYVTGEVASNAVPYFLKYIVPMRQRKDKHPNVLVWEPPSNDVSANVPFVFGA